MDYNYTTIQSLNEVVYKNGEYGENDNYKIIYNKDTTIILILISLCLISTICCYYLDYHENKKNTRILRRTHFDTVIYNFNSGDGDGGIEECVICLEEYRYKDIICKLKRCNHKFHIICFKKLTMSSITTCPVCRRNMYRESIV